MRMRRLGWAGVEIECDGETLVIDYVQDTSPMEAILRSADEPFPAASRPGATAAALLTHLHSDHADPAALAAALVAGAPVFRPAPASGNPADRELTARAEDLFGEHMLATQVVSLWEERSVGPFRLTAVPAVDGFGDLQYSWVVECGGRRIIHAGDTLFHSYWWRIANRFASFDVAFLPINAPVVEFLHLQPPSPFEAVMSPEEAAVAAHILKAGSVVPIHYGSLHKPPMYVETSHPVERLRTRTEQLGVHVMPLEAGHWHDMV